MTGREGNSQTKLTVSLATSLNVICYIAGNFEAGNSLNLALKAVVGQTTLLPSDVRDFAMLPAEILAGNSFIVRCHVTSK